LDVEVVDEVGRGSDASRVRRVVAHGDAPAAPARVFVAGQRRDTQFRYVNDSATPFVDDAQPAIRVDTKNRMFSFITMNWRGRPLTSLRTIIVLIALSPHNFHGEWNDTINAHSDLSPQAS
jgi:hypothetical protein